MGYESTIYFVHRYDFDKDDGYYSSAIQGMLEMYKMGYSDEVEDIRRCFDTKTDFNLWLPDYDEETGGEKMADIHEDKYGEHLKYASDKERLLQAVKIANAKNRYYKYFERLEKMIEIFKNDDDIFIVHYGH